MQYSDLTEMISAVDTLLDAFHKVLNKEAAAKLTLPNKPEDHVIRGAPAEREEPILMDSDSTYVDSDGRYYVQPATGTLVYLINSSSTQVEEARWKATEFLIGALKLGHVFVGYEAASVWITKLTLLQNYRTQYHLQKKVWDAAPSNMGYVWYPVLDRRGRVAIAKLEINSKAQQGKLLWHDLRDLRACINKHPQAVKTLLEAGLV